jgi:hypothetical protein
MITREQIHELAQFKDHAACALSFYFQPTPPRNKAHKEEAILTRDLTRETLRHLENKGKNDSGSARADLDRIIRLSLDLVKSIYPHDMLLRFLQTGATHDILTP